MKRRKPIYISDPRNEEYIKELQQELKHNGLKKDEFIRIQGVLLRKQGYARTQISQITGKSIEALEQWLRAYHKGGITALRAHVRETSPRAMLTPKQKEALKVIVGTKKPCEVGLVEDFWDKETLKKYIQMHYGVTYKSPESYRKLLHYCGLSYQKVEFIDKRQDQAKVDEFKKRFKAKIKGGSIVMSW
jgi:transposase